ncbi:MAG: cyanoexosortase B system-associated protein [Cyanobacteria bacterium J06627_8]
MNKLLAESPWARRSRLLATIVVLTIATVISVSNYVTGNWVWATPPTVPHQTQLNGVKETGITLSHWQTIEHYAGEISGYDWSVQALVPNDADDVDSEWGIQPENPAVLLLRPQSWYRDMPQVEWMDIQGVQQWTIDQKKQVALTVHPLSSQENVIDRDDAISGAGDRSIRVQTRFFRGWNRQQTYAVMQWYAWQTGGSPSASRWFWVDQRTQLRDRHRMPWVAVSIMVPITPLGDSQTAQAIAETLGQEVQATLIRDIFSGNG